MTKKLVVVVVGMWSCSGVVERGEKGEIKTEMKREIQVGLFESLMIKIKMHFDNILITFWLHFDWD